MTISKMKIKDYDEIYALWMSCNGIGLNNLDDSQSGIDRFLKRNPDTCFIAKEDNKIIGSILIGNDGRRGYIYHTAVSPDYQHQGIGKKLVETGINALEELEISKAALLVFEKNKDGNSFWEQIGFTKRDDLIYRNKEIRACKN